MKVHPIADDYADFTPAERSALMSICKQTDSFNQSSCGVVRSSTANTA